MTDSTSSHSERLAAELATFEHQETVHDLSPIMDYYADKAITPALRELGYENTYDFFAANIARRGRKGGSVSVVSYGCGNGELEVTVGELLVSRGFQQFHFDCVDINSEMLKRARERAALAGLSEHLTFILGDASDPTVTATPYDVHIAFQSLHHFPNLEGLFSKIAAGMEVESVFLTNDMVGRNGHMRWPETLVVVERLWSLLPDRYKHNHALRQLEREFVNFDCSLVGFEGIRAQDVFPLLARDFDFEELVTWGGVVDPFIDRCFGPNFDPGLESDRRFIDLALGIEAELQRAGIVKPTQIVARMRRKSCGAPSLDVSRFLRTRPPNEMPSLGTLSFDFSRLRPLVSHTLCGAADEPFLGEGFWDWEGEHSHRWARRVFSLRFAARLESAAYLCHFSIWFAPPHSDPGGNLEIFVNQVRVARVEHVHARLAEHPEGRLDVSFVTFGGPTTVTFAFARSQSSRNTADDRELGAVVRRFSATAEYS